MITECAQDINCNMGGFSYAFYVVVFYCLYSPVTSWWWLQKWPKQVN